ncbi:MAG: hypothetical protein EVA89_23785 [Sandaracinaceae bacterium]|nr:MAG: hypothetical protein EVA89_23785 [Sandaracinaceae bacterium]
MRAAAVVTGRVLLCLVGMGFGAPVAAQPEGDAAIYAQRHFERGAELYREARFEEALAAFRRSHGLFPSPNSMLFVGRSLRELGRNAEAVEAFEAAVLEARLRAVDEPRYRDTEAAAEAERDALSDQVGFVVLERGEGGLEGGVRVEGRAISPERFGLPIPVTPGEVAIAVGDAAPQRVQVSAGEELRVPLRAVSDRAAPSLAVAPSGGGEGWLVASGVAGGVALVGVAFALALTVAADARFSDLQARCGGLCPPDEAGAIAEGRDLELAGILTGVGAAVIGAGAVVLLIIGLAAGEPSLADGRVEF